MHRRGIRTRSCRSHVGVDPPGGSGTGCGRITFKDEATDFGLFDDLGTKLSGVAEHQLVRFGSYLENVIDSISISRDGPVSR